MVVVELRGRRSRGGGKIGLSSWVSNEACFLLFKGWGGRCSDAVLHAMCHPTSCELELHIKRKMCMR